MHPKQIHTLANITGSIYRIALNSVLLYWLFKRRKAPPEPPRIYH